MTSISTRKHILNLIKDLYHQVCSAVQVLGGLTGVFPLPLRHLCLHPHLFKNAMDNQSTESAVSNCINKISGVHRKN